MKKEKINKWVNASIIVFVLTALLSFLLYAGPIIASIIIAIIVDEPRFNFRKKLLTKCYFLFLGMMGLILVQTQALDVSRLNLVLNLIVFTVVLIGVKLPNIRPSSYN